MTSPGVDRKAGSGANANRSDAASRLAASNRKTALILASIALVFFFGVFAAHMAGSPGVSMTVLGAAVFLFLLLAIGRHLRR